MTRGFPMNQGSARRANGLEVEDVVLVANTLFSSYMMHINHCYFHLFAPASHFGHSPSPQHRFALKESTVSH